jgi:uncharacterized protein YggE
MISLVAILLSQAVAAERFVAVTGQCSREAAPDRASIVLTAEAREADAGTAGEKVTKLYEKLRAEVKKMKLADVKLQTSQYTVYPQQEYDNQGRAKKKFFMAQMGLEVETSDISKMGDVISVATKLGIQNVGGLNTFLSVVKSREEMEACLEDAVKNAHMKAERMVKASGAKVGEVTSLQEFRSETPGPVPMYAMGEAAMADSSSKAAAPSIEAKKQDINVTVHVSYSIK